MQLSTVPNAGLPTNFRRTKPKGDERLSAAGIMFVCPDGRALFVKRSSQGDHAGEWAFPGGRVEQDEEPADAAKREALEEVGHLSSWDLAPLHRETIDGVDFATFGQPVPDAFEPILNGEHEDHEWRSLLDPPEPLHPGVVRLLAKFFEEEADEPEHEDSGAAKELEHAMGGDSALRLALDRASVRTFDVDGRLHISETNVCKACVSPYRGDEIPEWEELGLEPDQIYQMLRPPEELEKATPTMNGVPLLRTHVPVDADDHQEKEIAGAVGTSARWDAPYIKNAVTIWPRKDIDGIESRDKCELSPGYHYKAVMIPGEFEGEPYDGMMTEIIFNHVALVEEGRQGPDVVIGDDASEVIWAAIEGALERGWRQRP